MRYDGVSKLAQQITRSCSLEAEFQRYILTWADRKRGWPLAAVGWSKQNHGP